jgi:hypothetical protein
MQHTHTHSCVYARAPAAHSTGAKERDETDDPMDLMATADLPHREYRGMAPAAWL